MTPRRLLMRLDSGEGSPSLKCHSSHCSEKVWDPCWALVPFKLRACLPPPRPYRYGKDNNVFFCHVLALVPFYGSSVIP